MSNTDSVTFTQFEEYDSTGVAIMKWINNTWSLEYIHYQPFSDEMNQDARLCQLSQDPSQIRITYNVFEHHDKVGQRHASKTKVTMRYRTLTINDSTMTYDNEQYMFPHTKRSVEKNCTYLPWGDVLYELGSTIRIFTVQGKWATISCPLLATIQSYYGSMVYISGSTPCVQYTDTSYLVCGHIKFKYKRLLSKPFFANIDWTTIKRHGQYVYCMILVEFTRTYQVLRCSRPFIPSRFNNHLPYLLVMPTGMCWIDTNLCITYGEGDVRCKCLFLSKKELDSILHSTLKPDMVNPCFITHPFKLYHYGYFGHYNCGDDAFRIVFDYLRHSHYPEAQVEFVNRHEFSSKHIDSLVVLGGGDVINDYFMKPIQNNPYRVIATSVGIPYINSNTIPYLTSLSYVALRDKGDATKFNTSYTPDYAFLLERVYSGITFPRRRRRCIGMSLVQTYHNKDYIHLYQSYVREMQLFITLLVQHKYTILLIPFCTSDHINEDDRILYKHICEQLDSTTLSHVSILQSSKDNVHDVYQAISSVEFMICSRFHSHIFSTSTLTPFMSVTCGRKCIRFMNQYGLDWNMYIFKTNNIDLPTHVDHRALFRFFTECYARRSDIVTQLGRIKTNILKDLDTHLVSFVSQVRTLSNRLPIIEYTPCASQYKASTLISKQSDDVECEHSMSNTVSDMVDTNTHSKSITTDLPIIYPVLTTTQPIMTTTQPIMTTTQPIMTTTTQPIMTTTTQPIMTTTTQPIMTTTQPIMTTTQPIMTTTQPIMTTTQPIMTTTQPIMTTTQPIMTTTQPIMTTTQPIMTTTQPMIWMITPVTVQPISIQPINQSSAYSSVYEPQSHDPYISNTWYNKYEH